MTLRFPKPAKHGPKPPQRIQRRVRPSPFRKRGNLGKLRQLADDAQSLYVRHRDGWRCRVCGSRRWEEMQAAHLFAKSEFQAIRYDHSNLWCLCFRCHRRYTSKPTLWDELLRQQLPNYESLKLMGRLYHGPHDYVLVFLSYRVWLGEMEDAWKISDRIVELDARARDLGIGAG